MTTYADFKIMVPPGTGPEVFTTCPQCSALRKKKFSKCLSVNLDKRVWFCAHCGWAGSLKSGVDTPGRTVYRRPEWPEQPVVTDPLLAWFAARGISPATVHAEGIAVIEAYLAALEERVPCIAFPYRKQGDVVNVKYRGLTTKAFQQVGGAEKILYRQDAIQRASVVIVEGEVDALSCIEAGYASVVSVPDGAPAPTAKNYSAKFTYLDQDPDPFADVQDIVLAVDADEPGQVLRQELIRRLGAERCRLVTWPTGCKDANDVLRQHGAEMLRSCLDQAKPCPVQDAVTVEDQADEVALLYQRGLSRGLSTGWEAVDRCYTIEPGQLTVVTGIPSSGKSEWLDALMLNLATLHGWRFAICSPENLPLAVHCSKLLEKQVGKPFRVGPTPRMSSSELVQGMEWLNQHVTFIMPEELLPIAGVLDRASALVRRKGIRGLILDPFNEFDHTRDKGMTETEYISNTLGALKRWARKHQVHVWLVAHPQKLYRREDGTYPLPTPYDIAGSAAFRNKADNCLTVWRDMESPDLPIQIHVQKVRFKHIGMVGMAELYWDRATGRYTQESQEHHAPRA